MPKYILPLASEIGDVDGLSPNSVNLNGANHLEAALVPLVAKAKKYPSAVLEGTVVLAETYKVPLVVIMGVPKKV